MADKPTPEYFVLVHNPHDKGYCSYNGKAGYHSQQEAFAAAETYLNHANNAEALIVHKVAMGKMKVSFTQ